MSESPSTNMAAEQTQFLTEVLSNLSHELRTPLAAAKGYTTSLLRHDRRLTRSERIAMLHEVDKACLRLENVIEQALQTTRLLHDKVELQHHPIDLIALTKQAVASIVQNRLEAQTNCSYHFSFHADELLVSGDEQLMFLALVHLLDNACKFSPEGGEVRITTSRTELDGIASIEWSVADQGKGIAEEHLPLLFTPFYRAENQLTRGSNGLGLGLTFCERVITLHGGVLGVDSQLGHGSRFWFTLPPLNV